MPLHTIFILNGYFFPSFLPFFSRLVHPAFRALYMYFHPSLYLHVCFQVFESALTWVKHEPEIRAQHLPDILSKVRLPLMTPQYLADVVGSEELIKGSIPCRYVSVPCWYISVPCRFVSVPCRYVSVPCRYVSVPYQYVSYHNRQHHNAN